MLKVHKFALLMVPNLSPYKFCPSRPWTYKCAEDLENASRAQTYSFKNIWHDGFKHCINWSCYRE